MLRMRWLLLIAFPAIASAQDDSCETYTPPAPGTVEGAPACIGVGLPLVNLSAEPVATCSNGCSEATRQVWLPVVNQSAVPLEDVRVSLYRQHALGRSLIQRELIDVPASSRAVVGPITLTEAEWGDALAVQVQTEQLDCNPADNEALSSAWTLPGQDVDNDGYTATACGGLDCDDEDDAIYPGADEPTGSTRDTNCDGELPPADPCDLDGDGAAALWCDGNDCNDADASISPSAEEIPNDGIDNDCDGEDACPEQLIVQGGRACNSSNAPLSGGLLAVGLLLSTLRRREAHNA